jgi:mannosyltransferase
MKPWKLTAIALLALALRLWHLGARSLWLDEGVSIGIARMPWSECFRALYTREANMSLYYFLLHYWSRLGDSEFFLRLASVLCGTAAIMIFVIVAERLLGRRVALIAGVLLSVNVLHIRYTRELRSYGLLLLLLALSWLFYERAVRRDDRRALVMWAIVSALAIYAHLFASLIVAAQLACLAFAALSRERLIRFTAAAVSIGALTLPLMFFVVYTKANPLSWVPPLTASALYWLAADFSNGGVAQAAFAMMLLVASFAILLRTKQNERWAVSIAVIGTLTPIALAALISIHQPAFLSRYLIIALPNFALALAIPLARLPRAAAVVTLCGILALGVPTLREFYGEPAWNDFRDAAAYVSQHSQPGDVMVIWEPLARPAVDYYARRSPNFPAIVFPGNPGTLAAADLTATPQVADIDRISATHPRIWVLYSSSTEPEKYSVWLTFFARRMSIHHSLANRFVTPGFPGTQVLEFVPR